MTVTALFFRINVNAVEGSDVLSLPKNDALGFCDAFDAVLFQINVTMYSHFV